MSLKLMSSMVICVFTVASLLLFYDVQCLSTSPQVVNQTGTLVPSSSSDEQQWVNTCGRLPYTGRGALRALNPIRPEQLLFHHPVFLPVMRAAEHTAFTVTEQEVIEVTGLRVPLLYDCTPWTGEKNPYYKAVPSRYLRCVQQMAMLGKGVLGLAPRPPVIDEEYVEETAIYQSVQHCQESVFVIVEAGARWGTWAHRAWAYQRTVRPEIGYRGLAIEPFPLFYEAITEVTDLNELPRENLTALPANASAELIQQWLGDDYIHLLDMDIQGAELDLLLDMEDLLDERVHRVIVGTHRYEIHDGVMHLLQRLGWRIWQRVPMQTNFGAIYQLLWNGPKWKELESSGACFETAHWGPIANWDGEIIADNPRFWIEGHTPDSCWFQM